MDKKKKMPEKMPEKKMRGGGLARKGVGMALRGGGMANTGSESRRPGGSGPRGPTGPGGQSRTSPAGGMRGGAGRYSGPSAGPSFKGGIAGAMAPRTTSMMKSLGFASGGIVNAPARSYKDMRAGAGSGVGRIQKTKIARGR